MTCKSDAVQIKDSIEDETGTYDKQAQNKHNKTSGVQEFGGTGTNWAVVEAYQTHVTY